METQFQQALYSATLKILRPLVRIFLRNGLPFKAFAELAQWVYVDIARREFTFAGKKTSDSRIAILTGLSRKAVAQLKRRKAWDDTTALTRYNRAAQVVSGWIRDRRFGDSRGAPNTLPLTNGSPSFQELVKRYSGDMPAQAVLDELLHAGVVESIPQGRLKLLKRAYVTAGDEAEGLAILGTDVNHLIGTIDHNLSNGTQAPFLQRKVSYDNLPAEALPEIRKFCAAQGQQLLENLDRILSAQDRDVNPSTGGSGRKLAGIGIYYFEEDL